MNHLEFWFIFSDSEFLGKKPFSCPEILINNNSGRTAITGLKKSFQSLFDDNGLRCHILSSWPYIPSLLRRRKLYRDVMFMLCYTETRVAYPHSSALGWAAGLQSSGLFAGDHLLPLHFWAELMYAERPWRFWSSFIHLPKSEVLFSYADELRRTILYKVTIRSR